MDITEGKDEELIAFSLNMWANHIETGSIIMSAVDATNQGKHKCIKGLNLAQQKFVIRLKELSMRIIE